MSIHQEMKTCADALYNVTVREEGTRYLGSDGTSGWIWYAARALEKEILALDLGNNDVPKSCNNDQMIHIKNKCGNLHILELGSGTGWLALHLAVTFRGATVTATERPCAIPLLIRNIYGNKENFDEENSVLQKNDDDDSHLLDIDVQTLEWDSEEIIPGKFDLIIGSDVLYLKEYYLPLLNTIIRHAEEANNPVIMISWEERKPLEETEFLSLADKCGFKFGAPKRISINPGTNNPILLLFMIYKSQV